MKNKKVFIIILISVSLVAIIGGWLFVSSNKKTYNSFPDIFKTMDVSTKNEKSNIETLKRFAEKNEYIFQEGKDKNVSKISIISKDYIQNLIYSPEENELSFIKMNSNDLTMPEEKKIKNIAEEDSFDKVMNELGEPDKMRQNGDGLIVLRWDDTSEKGYLSLSIELEDNKVTKITKVEI
ncbi:hypothetical protein [Enterococcus ureasiticus]|uniref:Uncharacterized protein n=1 Tax=Enterococcus ureasiticus TaxID=903984 RepID=A0A1E5GCK2_9ENTE|nr:hypothetical protein [Enterococcus ureasiticus]OEG10409.1 hypothetical protein BCR21_13770 [Enterococcus ureasiticus]